MKKKTINNLLTWSWPLGLITAMFINLQVAKKDYHLSSMNISNYYTAQAIGRLPDANDQIRELYRVNTDTISITKTNKKNETFFIKLKKINYALAPSNLK